MIPKCITQVNVTGSAVALPALACVGFVAQFYTTAGGVCSLGVATTQTLSMANGDWRNFACQNLSDWYVLSTHSGDKLNIVAYLE